MYDRMFDGVITYLIFIGFCLGLAFWGLIELGMWLVNHIKVEWVT